MVRLRHNVAANFIGQAWTALIGVLFMPVYIRLLGMESFGLIGVYVSLQALLFTLDLGLSTTLNRELARHTRTGTDADSIRDRVRTLEWAFLPLFLMAASVAIFAGDALAEHWLQPVTMSHERVAHAVMLMGIAISIQWPAAFYAGGVSGLERQVSVNAATMVFTALRWILVIPVLQWAGPTIETFLHWQIALAVLQTLTMRGMLSLALPAGRRRARFIVDVLREVQGFALGMFSIALLSFVLIQMDRIVLSRVLPLDKFGQYALVATAAATLSRVFSPFFAALYPRYTGLVAAGERDLLVTLYHRSNQLLAIVVASIASVLAFFAEDVLRLWAHDPALASTGAPILATLVVGTALNGLMNLPYALQLAHGWTRLAVYQNLAAIVVVIPAVWLLAQRYGALGAAAVWVALNLSYVVVGIPLMHRRLLPREMWTWYFKDVLPPVIAALAAGLLLRHWLPPMPDNLQGLSMLAAASTVILGFTAACSPQVWHLLRRHSTL